MEENIQWKLFGWLQNAEEEEEEEKEDKEEQKEEEEEEEDYEEEEEEEEKEEEDGLLFETHKIGGVKKKIKLEDLFVRREREHASPFFEKTP
ncbi:hypothetical protein HZH66_010516 [Vespula vulgaris]|uniref:Uncharacterized protein n=1 Tax=Vespula vulgaris TaxID=7454 RepID=A0A834JIL8_VESVU|nr:hypothetical protein HZH66_010516 [Vespula vulgaris]